MTWQAGGGYGDPLTREPDAVARDVREQKVTAEAARAVYGVVSKMAPSAPPPPRPTATSSAHAAGNGPGSWATPAARPT